MNVVYLKPFKRLLSRALKMKNLISPRFKIHRNISLQNYGHCYCKNVAEGQSIATSLRGKATAAEAIQEPTPLERRTSKAAFSLVEMLMALLVASLLLAALAPVMTRKMNENLVINGDFKIQDKETITYEIKPEDDKYCSSEVQTDEDGSEYYECRFTVPSDYSGPMEITMLSAGGGGGTAPTAGFVEYTDARSYDFSVPEMVNKLEVTLVSGGGGGGAGGQVAEKKIFDTPGVSSWDNIPNVIKDKYVSVIGCGGGGGSGGGYSALSSLSILPGGGGSGGYRTTPIAVKIGANASSIPYQVGGGGGGASDATSAVPAQAGACGGGGDGGNDAYKRPTNNCKPAYGGSGAAVQDASKNHYVAGGGYPDGGSGNVYVYSSDAGNFGVLDGGKGSSGGDGGSTGYQYSDPSIRSIVSGGGGGTYGGGGGGAACSGPGGGGGGPTYFNNIWIASGGGGGGGIGGGYGWVCAGAGGGGGGGNGGGKGGSGGSSAVADAKKAFSGSGGGGGMPDGVGGAAGAWGINVPLSKETGWGSKYCRGGGYVTPNYNGESGKSGIIEVTYLDYGPGGSGGGAAAIVPTQPVNASPRDTFKITVGKGGEGVKAVPISGNGVVDKPYSIDTASNPFSGTYIKTFGQPSIFADANGQVKLTTGTTDKASRWATSGCSSGKVVGDGIVHNCAKYGSIHTGVGNFDINPSIGGFAIGHGNTAGNIKEYSGSKTYANKTSGGDGGGLTMFYKGDYCTPGKGGKTGDNSSSDGTSAVGYGGCGGGGGYGLASGGDGARGYARISWNAYWNGDKRAYEYESAGSGGGGASGNVMKFSVANVIAGHTYTIRIGKGGKGAYVQSNTLFPAQNGGSTIFEIGVSDKLKVAGGTAGLSATLNNNGIANGKGGSVPSAGICRYNTSDYTKKSTYCTRGGAGVTSVNSNGGKGGNMGTYGEGGDGGAQSTDDGSSGGSGKGVASGGGGAAIRKRENISVENYTYNPNRGGDGANGKVIIKMLRPTAG